MAGPLVRQLWAATTPATPPSAREHILPHGDMHLVIRPSGESIRLFDQGDRSPIDLGPAVVGGVRTAYYVKAVPGDVQSVGVAFHPAAAHALLGCTAEELAGRHVALDDLWGPRAVANLREQLQLANSPAAQLDIVERALGERLRNFRGLHPAVADVVERFRSITNVAAVVRQTGYSHRTVAEQFRRAMGIGPKAYLQVMRMRRLLACIGDRSWSDLAADAGFSDQAHFIREFRRFTGVTPTDYARAAPADASHFKILQDPPIASR